MEKIRVLIEGGKATPSAPLGPALGPLGVNIGEIVSQINQKTSVFESMKVPVDVLVDPKTKEFEISVGTPPVSALILKEANVGKGATKTASERVADLRIEQVKKIAQTKCKSMLGNTLKAKAKEVIGTCVSLGVTIEGKDAREAQALVDKGEWDKVLKE